MKQSLICIVCPKGCHIDVELGDNNEILNVSGNTCLRGLNYAKEEVVCPKRTLTTTVKVINGCEMLVPVVSEKPISKDKLQACMDYIRSISIPAPIKCEQVVIENICNTGINMIASMPVESI